MDLKAEKNKIADMCSDMQAYFEVREWDSYQKNTMLMEQSVRNEGEIALADKLKNLGIAAREKNVYYIEAHQDEVRKEYLEFLNCQGVSEDEPEQGELAVQENIAQILIVDDDKESLRSLKSILTGFAEVQLAESGQKALQEMKERVPDLLMIDVYMPDMDGFELMNILRRDEQLKEIPVVLLTTDHDREVEVRGFKAGAQDFIIKPFAKEMVLQRVGRILELSRLQKNLQEEVKKQNCKAEERRKQVERLSDQIIQALAETIDAKDRYTNGHSRRVAQYSLEIAKRVGKDEKEQERIYYMAMLHDIGKIGIPDSIITKNSSLSEKEYFVTRKHPEIGAEILANISEIPDLGIGARWHHERYDGTGYPDGLKGLDIPEEARMIAVADAYDAMASKRSYREVLPQQVVYEEIKKGRGTQFDPVFADIMLTLMEEDNAYDMREK